MKSEKFQQILPSLFDAKKIQSPLFIFEIANNHMGDVDHGKRIITEHSSVAKKFPFIFGFKFQFRNLPTFIHDDFKSRMDIAYVKRFTETALSFEEFKVLTKTVDTLDHVTIATPFDEASVDMIEKLNINIIKVASASCTDWPLLERVAKTEKPIILSVGGTTIEDIDRVVSFLKNRNKHFALLHCVGEYPTPNNHLELNQIDILKERYPDIIVGFSTHEDPSNTTPIQIAIAKKAMFFEKHIAIATEKYKPNAYSATPEQVREWLEAAQETFKICGNTRKKRIIREKEISDLRSLKRGIFAKKLIQKGSVIQNPDIFFAFPNQQDQLLANEYSKYTKFIATNNIHPNQPLTTANTLQNNIRDHIVKIVKKVKEMIKEQHIPFPSQSLLEISHHYGIEQFYKYGAVIITVVNRDYCKKLIIFMKGQTHPAQYHKKKEESFHVLEGEFVVELNGQKKTIKKGDVITIERGVKHLIYSPTGGIIEELSSTHYNDDSYYEDKRIMNNPNRKTYVTFWFG